jgi:hypothetical protein
MFVFIQLPKHMETECEKTLIECKFKVVGCEEKVGPSSRNVSFTEFTELYQTASSVVFF